MAQASNDFNVSDGSRGPTKPVGQRHFLFLTSVAISAQVATRFNVFGGLQCKTAKQGGEGPFSCF